MVSVKRIIQVMLLLSLGSLVLPAHAANEAVSLFAKGNEAYRSQNYKQAFEYYQKAAQDSTFGKDASVFYNLGNAAFKLNRLGLSILNYERARRLAPRDPDIQSNLAYAKGLVELRVEDKRNWYLQKVMEALEQVTIHELVRGFLIVYLLFVSGLLTNLMAKRKPVLGSLTTGWLIALAVSTLLLLVRFGDKIHPTAVVTNPKVDVRYGPSDSDKLAFSLSEGILVNIDDNFNDWYKVSLRNGESGWSPRSGVEIV